MNESVKLWSGDSLDVTFDLKPEQRWAKMVRFIFFKPIRATIKIECVDIKIANGTPTVEIKVTTGSIEAVLSRE